LNLANFPHVTPVTKPHLLSAESRSIITGDNERVTHRIGAQLGLSVTGSMNPSSTFLKIIPQYVEVPPNLEAKRIISYFSAVIYY
jgi:hypothetical protein